MPRYCWRALLITAGFLVTGVPASAWENLHGYILTQPNCVSWGSNRIDCFVLGRDSNVGHLAWDGSGWRGWNNLGGRFSYRPECVSSRLSRIDCFAVDVEHRGIMWNATDGRRWGGWVRLPGRHIFQGPPSCAARAVVRAGRAVDRIDCFAKDDEDRGIWWNHGEGPPGTNLIWGGWVRLGRQHVSGAGDFTAALPPECISWIFRASFRIDCFALRRDGTVWWNQGDGNNLAGWRGWERLGTQTFRDLPSCVVHGDGVGHVYCFALGWPDFHGPMMVNQWNHPSAPERWTGWTLPPGGGHPPGFVSRYGPSCVFVRGSFEPRSFSTIHCLVAAVSETDSPEPALKVMWHRSLDVTNSRWSDRWRNLGGTLRTAPDCVSWGPNRVDCFVRTGDREMHHKWWNGFRWGP